MCDLGGQYSRSVPGARGIVCVARANAFGDRAVRNDSGSEDSMGFTADFRNNSCQMRLPSTVFLLEIAKCACPVCIAGIFRVFSTQSGGMHRRQECEVIFARTLRAAGDGSSLLSTCNQLGLCLVNELIAISILPQHGFYIESTVGQVTRLLL